MNKYFKVTVGLILLLFLTHVSNEYFEDKIQGQNKKILGISKEDRFFLPFPKDYNIVSSVTDQRNTKIIINVKKPSQEIKDFYKEILRSKEYENDYEYEKENIIELRYLKESEDLKITITQDGEFSLIEFNHYN
jgi:hypothetical protein